MVLQLSLVVAKDANGDILPQFTHETATTSTYRLDANGTPLVTNKADWFQYHHTPGSGNSLPGPLLTGDDGQY